jgi:ATP-binding cassette subfamily B protein
VLKVISKKLKSVLNSRIFKHYVCIKQHDITDCAAACLATISKQYGLKLPISKIREVAGTDKQGTNAYGVIKAAEKLGFTAKGVKGNMESFFSEFPLPAIAHVIVNGSLLHYVVIHYISKTEVIIADPGKGIVKYTPDEFFKMWTGVLILMVPTAQFKKGNEAKGIFTRFFGLLKPQIRLLKSVFKGGWIGNLQSSMTGFIGSVGGIVILWVGAYAVLQGEMSIGQLITFNALLAYFLDPVRNLINLQPMMQTAIVASDRLGEMN